MADTLLTVAAVAKRLSLGSDAVLSLIHAGRLKAVNVGLGEHRPRWRISPEAIDEFLYTRTAQPPIMVRRRKRKSAVIEFF